MTTIESLQAEIEKLIDAKSKAAKEQRFELSALLRDKEQVLLAKVSDLLTESQSITKYAALHFQNKS